MSHGAVHMLEGSKLIYSHLYQTTLLFAFYFETKYYHVAIKFKSCFILVLNLAVFSYSNYIPTSFTMQSTSSVTKCSSCYLLGSHFPSS